MARLERAAHQENFAQSLVELKGPCISKREGINRNEPRQDAYV